MATDVMKKVPVREQDPKVRATNFEEVCLGYNKEEAMAESERCLNCKNARCIQGCLFPSIYPDLSRLLRTKTLRRLLRSSQSQVHFLQSAVVYVLRRASVKVFVCAA